MMKKFAALFAAAATVLSLTGCAKQEKIVGTWKIDRVLAQAEQDGETMEMERETADSLFESEASYYQFNKDGTAIHHMEDGGGAMDVQGTWKKTDEGTYQYDDGQGETREVWYVVSDDTLHVEWYSENPDDPYYNICYIYARVK